MVHDSDGSDHYVAYKLYAFAAMFFGSLLDIREHIVSAGLVL